ncbi:DUF5674 family protein [Limnofasciculus baicalensis]|uniref:DUF5674 family protein n=1 Tax=Limnofasciculus baicalensis BBK-W-15 TaxID=2699891 RepID=A0AAE3GLX4_9CYAN|nr:DUF5674 family protein [Limnofasciculus baicalensis]MCP2727031.1 DUF5674 family protein [Limnofasciculus baicalensis BBK-W-15]
MVIGCWLLVIGCRYSLCDHPLTQEVGYESLINIRPRQNNRSIEIQNPVIRERVTQIVKQLLGGLGEMGML